MGKKERVCLSVKVDFRHIGIYVKIFGTPNLLCILFASCGEMPRPCASEFLSKSIAMSDTV